LRCCFVAFCCASFFFFFFFVAQSIKNRGTAMKPLVSLVLLVALLHAPVAESSSILQRAGPQVQISKEEKLGRTNHIVRRVDDELQHFGRHVDKYVFLGKAVHSTRELVAVAASKHHASAAPTVIPGSHCGVSGRVPRFFIPDQLTFSREKVSFSSACLKHDQCYERDLPHAQCDAMLARELQIGCTTLSDMINKSVCETILSGLYEAGVIVGGKDAYIQAHQDL
jgi:hypothetical protein